MHTNFTVVKLFAGCWHTSGCIALGWNLSCVLDCACFVLHFLCVHITAFQTSDSTSLEDDAMSRSRPYNLQEVLPTNMLDSGVEADSERHTDRESDNTRNRKLKQRSRTNGTSKLVELRLGIERSG